MRSIERLAVANLTAHERSNSKRKDAEDFAEERKDSSATFAKNSASFAVIAAQPKFPWATDKSFDLMGQLAHNSLPFAPMGQG